QLRQVAQRVDAPQRLDVELVGLAVPLLPDHVRGLVPAAQPLQGLDAVELYLGNLDGHQEGKVVVVERVLVEEMRSRQLDGQRVEDGEFEDRVLERRGRAPGVRQQVVHLHPARPEGLEHLVGTIAQGLVAVDMYPQQPPAGQQRGQVSFRRDTQPQQLQLRQGRERAQVVDLRIREVYEPKPAVVLDARQRT